LSIEGNEAPENEALENDAPENDHATMQALQQKMIHLSDFYIPNKQ
jgi:hypothetical protein